MRKGKIVLGIFILLAQISIAQQWGGSGNINGNIFRNGNVGIGTNSPVGPLHVRSSSDAILNLQSSDDKWLYSQWLDKSGKRKTWMGLNSNLTSFNINVENGTNKILFNGGNVGIGTNSPVGPLHVRSSSDAILNLQSSDDKWLYSQWLDKSGKRKTWMGLNSNLTSFNINVENGTNKILFNGGNVGIGTNSPVGPLHVRSSSDAILNLQSSDDKWLYSQWLDKSGKRKTWMGLNSNLTSFNINVENGTNKILFNGGNVGIGTNSPVGPLHVRSSSDAILNLQSSDDKWLYSQWLDKSGKRKTWMGLNANLTSFNINVENGTNKILFNGGSVGIGTTNPGSYKLAVNGKIRAKEVVVETGWSDFVFEDDYDLPTLKEVESFIESNGHLKDIPSAKEVSKNGIGVGEIESKLLQKIEELTLYLIEQNKKNESQSVEIESLKSKIEDLKK